MPPQKKLFGIKAKKAAEAAEAAKAAAEAAEAERLAAEDAKAVDWDEPVLIDPTKPADEAAAGAPAAAASQTPADVLLNFAQHILNIAQDDKRRHAVLAGGTIPPLVALLTSRAQGGESAATAAEAISWVSKDPNAAEAIRQAGGIEALIELLGRGSSKAKENAARALGNLASENPTCRQVIRKANAVSKLVALLSGGPGSEVATQAAIALCNLLGGEGQRDDPKIAATILAAPALLAALKPKHGGTMDTRAASVIKSAAALGSGQKGPLAIQVRSLSDGGALGRAKDAVASIIGSAKKAQGRFHPSGSAASAASTPADGGTPLASGRISTGLAPRWAKPVASTETTPRTPHRSNTTPRYLTPAWKDTEKEKPVISPRSAQAADKREERVPNSFHSSSVRWQASDYAGPRTDLMGSQAARPRWPPKKPKPPPSAASSARSEKDGRRKTPWTPVLTGPEGVFKDIIGVTPREIERVEEPVKQAEETEEPEKKEPVPETVADRPRSKGPSPKASAKSSAKSSSVDTRTPKSEREGNPFAPKPTPAQSPKTSSRASARPPPSPKDRVGGGTPGPPGSGRLAMR